MLSAQQVGIGNGARTSFGVGSVGSLPETVAALGGRRVFLVTDRGLVDAGISGRVAGLLRAAGVETLTYADLRPNPVADDIAAGAAALREFGDCVVVALGGGTALDCAKGISLGSRNDVPVRDLDYRNVQSNPGLPIVAVPTTAGTGSETNSFGVMEDHEAHRKFYIGDATVTPRAVLLDPELTLGLPAGATAATGMDALTHAIESLLARHGNPWAHGLSLQVIRMVHRWLPVAVADGSDLEARSQLLLAAHMAGLAFGTTGLGAVHGLGHTISAMIGTPHGVALSVVLAPVLEMNLAARTGELAEVALLLGLGRPGAGQAEQAGAATAAIRALAAGVGMPTSLAAIGFDETMSGDLVTGALDDIVTANNPVTPSPEQMTALVRSVLA